MHSWRCDACACGNPDAASCCLECGTPRSEEVGGAPADDAAANHTLRVEAALIDPDLEVVEPDNQPRRGSPRRREGHAREWIVADKRAHHSLCLVTMRHFHAQSVSPALVRDVMSDVRRCGVHGALVILEGKLRLDVKGADDSHSLPVDDAAALALLDAPVELHTLTPDLSASVRGAILRVVDPAVHGPSHAWKLQYNVTRKVAKAAVRTMASPPARPAAVKRSTDERHTQGQGAKQEARQQRGKAKPFSSVSSVSSLPASASSHSSPLRSSSSSFGVTTRPTERHSVDVLADVVSAGSWRHPPRESSPPPHVPQPPPPSQGSVRTIYVSEVSTERRARAQRRRELLAELQEIERLDREEEDRLSTCASSRACEAPDMGEVLPHRYATAPAHVVAPAPAPHRHATAAYEKAPPAAHRAPASPEPRLPCTAQATHHTRNTTAATTTHPAPMRDAGVRRVDFPPSPAPPIASVPAASPTHMHGGRYSARSPVPPLGGGVQGDAGGRSDVPRVGRPPAPAADELPPPHNPRAVELPSSRPVDPHQGAAGRRGSYIMARGCGVAELPQGSGVPQARDVSPLEARRWEREQERGGGAAAEQLARFRPDMSLRYINSGSDGRRASNPYSTVTHAGAHIPSPQPVPSPSHRMDTTAAGIRVGRPVPAFTVSPRAPSEEYRQSAEATDMF